MAAAVTLEEIRRGLSWRKQLDKVFIRLYDIGNANLSNRRRIGSHDPIPATSLHQKQSSTEGPATSASFDFPFLKTPP